MTVMVFRYKISAKLYINRYDWTWFMRWRLH